IGVSIVKNLSTVTAIVSNSSGKNLPSLFTVKIFPWNLIGGKPLQSITKPFILKSGQTSISMTTPNYPLPTETILLSFTSEKGESPIYMIESNNSAFQQSRITLIGTSGFPINSSDPFYAFVCLQPITFPESVQTKVTLDILDANNKT